MEQPPAPAPLPSPYPVAGRTNTMAVISLASGIASWVVFPLVGGVVAVITGHLAKRQIRQTGEQGDGLATIGLILGYVHLAVAALLILVVILFFGAVIATLVAGGATTTH